MACVSAQVVFTPLLPLLILALLLLYGFRPVLAQPGQDYLAGHNAARDLVGVPSLVWDTTAASYAQNYSDAQRVADACRQLLPSHGPYGENKFWGGPGKVWTAADAVQTWVSVGKFYNVTTNTCAAGQQCGEYTQVVWRNTTRLGCGSAVCSDNSTFIMCSYSPPGNIVGQRAF